MFDGDLATYTDLDGNVTITSESYFILGAVGIITTFDTLFCLDGISIPTKKKKNILTCI